MCVLSVTQRIPTLDAVCSPNARRICLCRNFTYIFKRVRDTPTMWVGTYSTTSAGIELPGSPCQLNHIPVAPDSGSLMQFGDVRIIPEYERVRKSGL